MQQDRLNVLCEADLFKYEFVEPPDGASRFMNDGKTPRVFVKGVLQKYGVLNQNNRIYTEAVLKREVNAYQRLIKENRSYGECDHPESSVVELKNTSHLIRKTWWEGNELHGIVEVASTPSGNIIREILNMGGTLGISSRGVGSVEKVDGVDVVQDDFMLFCWDFVTDPSTPGAFMFKESKEGVGVSKILVENARRSWGMQQVVQSNKAKQLLEMASRMNNLYANITEGV